jgi:hypothetical protein
MLLHLQVYANFFALVILLSGGGLAGYGEFPRFNIMEELDLGVYGRISLHVLFNLEY